MLSQTGHIGQGRSPAQESSLHSWQNGGGVENILHGTLALRKHQEAAKTWASPAWLFFPDTRIRTRPAQGWGENRSRGRPELQSSHLYRKERQEWGEIPPLIFTAGGVCVVIAFLFKQKRYSVDILLHFKLWAGPWPSLHKWQFLKAFYYF